MDTKGNHAGISTRPMYTFQSDTVYSLLCRKGVCYSRKEYVQKKYGESAWIFLTAYQWFVKEAGQYVALPRKDAFPYWVYGDLYSFDASGEGHLLTLDVPVDEAVFFRAADWTQILCLRYLGEDEEDTESFYREFRLQGLREETVMKTAFYPEWKRRIIKSWSRLFRYHEQIKQGHTEGLGSIQAGVWCLKKEWIHMDI